MVRRIKTIKREIINIIIGYLYMGGGLMQLVQIH